MPYCRNLKELEMIKSGPLKGITAHEFLKIKDVMQNLKKFSSDCYGAIILNRMKPNTLLKSLELKTYGGTYIDTILSKFSNLEEFKCARALIDLSNVSNRKISSVSQMKNLKKISLSIIS